MTKPLTNDQIIQGFREILNKAGNKRCAGMEKRIATLMEKAYIEGLILSGNLEEHAWIQLRQKMGKSILD